ncbi:MAG: hypothetical protein AAFW84_26970 [Cyanobacteria bacterium J06635_15]
MIQQGQQYGAEIIGYYFESTLNKCLARNQQRAGKAKIPEVGLYATIKKLVRPTYAEGFDQLFHVAIAADNTFRVQAWQEDIDDG